MPASDEQKKIESTLAKYLALAVPYGSAVCLIYLFSYWGSFGINILEYAGLPDIARLSLYPVLGSFFFFIAGVAVSQILLGNQLPPGGGADSRLSKFVFKHWRLLTTIYILGIGVAIAFGPEPRKWVLVASLTSFLCVPLSHADIAISLFPNPRVRWLMLFVIIWIPGMSYAFGQLDAYLIKDGEVAQAVDVTRAGIQLTSDATHPVYYVGYIGQRFAFYETSTKEVLLVRAELVPSLALPLKPVSSTFKSKP